MHGAKAKQGRENCIILCLQSKIRRYSPGPRMRYPEAKMLYINVLQYHLYLEGVTNMFKPIFRVHSYNVLGSSNNAFVPMTCTKAA